MACSYSRKEEGTEAAISPEEEGECGWKLCFDRYDFE